MFVRVKTTPNSPRKSVQIVESVRDGEKVKQRIVRYVGIAMDEQELKKMVELAEHIKSKIEHQHNPTLFGPEEMAQQAIKSKSMPKLNDEELNVNLKNLEEEQRAVVGIHEIYGKIYEELGFGNILKNPSSAEILKHIVMARIANPVSKRASVRQLEQDFGIQINLQGVYRMMDCLNQEAQQAIQDCAYNTAKELFGQKIDLIFFDATTLYFESFQEDEFKQNGYSKDLKFNQPQVLISLMVTKQGIPIGFQAFPGSTYEGHTLMPILEKVKANYQLDKVIFVGDSGILNNANLLALEQAKYEYIIGARLKKQKTEIKKKILDLNAYATYPENGQTCLTAIYLDEDHRLIVTHNVSRAKKDAYDREKALNKLMEKLKKSKKCQAFISNYGYKKYLNIKGQSQITLNEEKLQEEAQWDGLHGIITNAKHLSPHELLEHYRGLWQVEESFRITKHDLKVRPIFHWTPERVKAHLALSFIAFCCVRHLEYRVALQHEKMSPEAIRQELIRIQSSILKDKSGQRYVIPSKASHHGLKIYQVMGLKYSTTPYKLISSKPKFHKP
ncbi:Transposase, IS4 family [Neochlamydia sp. TUME1]|uniref:IS1634 family transposase n=1 Tax=Neochlamydia sp. TUME1 TaxID=1478174 RepID=UPI00057FEB58|nr:IS1634 family transposase [Neochlamydia sp. TUME1]KIC71463.1 Transposase, IS4 family [Neochlamydia sp. TUME1]